MIKLFASDLDGTLLNLLHETDRTIRDAIREVTASGAHFSVATGRTMRTSQDFGFSGLACEAVCANGSMVLGRDGSLLRHVDVDPAVLEEMLKAFPQIPFECVGLEKSLVRGSQEAYQAGYRSEGLLKQLVANIVLRGMRRDQASRVERLFDQTDADVLTGPVCKVNCRVADEGLERELHAFLAEHADAIVNAPFNPVMFEMTSAGVNKGEAVAWLASYLGICEDEVAVYGDGGNDVVMLERFARYRHAFVTHGATPAAKRAAGQAIGSCIVHAVPRHMLATVRTQGRVGYDGQKGR